MEVFKLLIYLKKLKILQMYITMGDNEMEVFLALFD